MADNKCNTADCGGNCDSCNGDITVTLTLDNDETVECAILTIFPVGRTRLHRPASSRRERRKRRRRGISLPLR